MAYGVDTAMNDVQPPVPHPAIDDVAAGTERHQLGPTDDSVLARR